MVDLIGNDALRQMKNWRAADPDVDQMKWNAEPNTG